MKQRPFSGAAREALPKPGAGQRRNALAVQLPVLQLAGNQAVAGVIQRAPSSVAGFRAELGTTQGLVEKAHGALSEFGRDGVRDISDVATSMNESCGAYEKAHTAVTGVLASAAAEFKLTDQMVDAAVDFAVGKALDAAFGPAGEVIGELAKRFPALIQAAGGKLAGLAPSGTDLAKQAVAAASGREARDKALELGVQFSPLSKKLDDALKISEHYRSAASLLGPAATLLQVQRWISDVKEGLALAESNRFENGWGAESLIAAAQYLRTLEPELQRLAQRITEAKIAIAAAKAEAEKIAKQNQEEHHAEQELWLEYIASLSPSEDVEATNLVNPEEDWGVDADKVGATKGATIKEVKRVDGGTTADTRYKILDKIEGHLREVGVLSADGKAQGRLAADFGGYTTEADTEHASAEAAALVKNRYLDAVGPRQVGKTVPVVEVISRSSLDVRVRIEGTKYQWLCNTSWNSIRDAHQRGQSRPAAEPEVYSRPGSDRTRTLIPGSRVRLDRWVPELRAFMGTILTN